MKVHCTNSKWVCVYFVFCVLTSIHDTGMVKNQRKANGIRTPKSLHVERIIHPLHGNHHVSDSFSSSLWKLSESKSETLNNITMKYNSELETSGARTGNETWQREYKYCHHICLESIARNTWMNEWRSKWNILIKCYYKDNSVF